MPYGTLDRSRLDRLDQQLRDVTDVDYQSRAYIITQQQKQKALAQRASALQGYLRDVSPQTVNIPASATQVPREPNLPADIPITESDLSSRLNKSTTGDSIAARHNNPANLKYAPWMKSLGAVPGDVAPPEPGDVAPMHWAKFTDPEIGRAAIPTQLLHPSFSSLSVNDAMKKWSNHSYGGEIAPDISQKKISDLNDDEMERLVNSMTKREDWTGGQPDQAPMNVTQLISAKQAVQYDTQTTPARTETIPRSSTEQQAAFTKTFANLLSQGTPEGDEAAKYLIELHKARQPQLSELGAYLSGIDLSGFEKMKHTPHGGQLRGVTENGNFPVVFDPETQQTNVIKPGGGELYDVGIHGNILATNFKTQKDIAETRGASYAQSRMTNVYDSKRGANVAMTVADFINANKKERERYFSTVGQKDTFQRATLLGDIYGTINNTKESLNKLKEFSPGLRAQLAFALKSPNPDEAISNLITSEFRQGLSKDEADYAQNLAQLAENAMAMRSVLGAGQGSDELREAIRATIPSASTPSVEYARGQLDKFQQVLDRLGKNVLNVPLPSESRKGAIPGATGSGQKIKVWE